MKRRTPTARKYLTAERTEARKQFKQPHLFMPSYKEFLAGSISERTLFRRLQPFFEVQLAELGLTKGNAWYDYYRRIAERSLRKALRKDLDVMTDMRASGYIRREIRTDVLRERAMISRAGGKDSDVLPDFRTREGQKALQAERFPSPEQALIRKEQNQKLRELVKALPEKDRIVLERWFGLKKPWSFDRIGAELGRKGLKRGVKPGKKDFAPVTRPGVQQARRSALLKLKKAIKNNPVLREVFEEYL